MDENHENEQIEEDAVEVTDTVNSETETPLLQRSSGMPPKKSGSKKIVFLLLIILVVVAGGTFAYLNSKGEDKKVDDKKTEQTTAESKVEDNFSQDTLDLKAALDSLGELFIDGDPSNVRTDVKDEEFDKVEKALKKVKKEEIKKELADKLEEIKQAQTGN